MRPGNQDLAWNILLERRIPFYNHLDNEGKFYGVVDLFVDPFSEAELVRDLYSSGAFQIVGFMYPEGGPDFEIAVLAKHIFSDQNNPSPEQFRRSVEALFVRFFSGHSVNAYEWERRNKMRIDVVGRGLLGVDSNFDKVTFEVTIRPEGDLWEGGAEKGPFVNLDIEIDDAFAVKVGGTTLQHPPSDTRFEDGHLRSSDPKLKGLLEKVRNYIIGEWNGVEPDDLF